ncbi:MAG: tetratricopeptide repeat protein [bacterium]
MRYRHCIPFRYLIAMSSIILFCITCSVYAQQLIWVTDYKGSILDARKQNKFLLLLFYSEKDNIAATKKLEEKTLRDKDTLPSLVPFILIKLNVDMNPELTQKYHIIQVPTIVFTQANGTEIDRATGYQSPKKFQKVIQDIAVKNLTYGSPDELIKQLRVKPKDVTVLYAFGVEQMNIRDFMYAERVLKQVLELDPMDDSGLGDVTRLNLGFCLTQGNPDDVKLAAAVHYLNEFLQKYPKSDYLSEVYYQLGYCYTALGDKEKAIEIYKTAIPTATEPWLTKLKKQLEALPIK